MKRKKKNLMVNGYRCLRIEREREREREEVSKKKEKLGSLSQKTRDPRDSAVSEVQSLEG
jgi:hypothetical protein